MISPSSPRVQVTSVTGTPAAAYRAMVAPVSIDSSSGWACTSSSPPPVSGVLTPSETSWRPVVARPGGKIRAMTESFPRQQARTRRFSLGVPRSFTVAPDGSRVAFLRSKGADDPVTCLWQLHVETGQEELVADPATLDPAGEDRLPAGEGPPRARPGTGRGDRRVRCRPRALGGRVRPGGPGVCGRPGPLRRPGRRRRPGGRRRADRARIRSAPWRQPSIPGPTRPAHGSRTCTRARSM